MFGSLITMGGTIVASARQRRANNEAYQKGVDLVDGYKNQQTNRYNMLRNADKTELAANKAAWTKTQQAFRRNNQALAGRNAVMGGSNATVAAAKEAANNALAQTASNIAASGTEYDRKLDEQQAGVESNVLKQNQSLISQRLAGKTTANKMTAEAFQKAGEGIDQSEHDAMELVAKMYGGGAGA